MHILHICSDFSNQRIYNELITHLSQLNLEQTVYIPVRTEREIGKYKNHTLQLVHYRYSQILKPFHRFLFHLKIRTVYKDLIKNVEVSKINKTHAHFLFSDGAVALKLKKEKGIPYIVTVRNTDINVFYKYMYHLRVLGLEILQEAERIIFITPSYHWRLLDKYIAPKFHDELNLKISVIPNGVEHFWLNNSPKKKIINKVVLKLLYVGDFSRNKNIRAIIKVIQKLNQQNINSSLTLVGGGGNEHSEIMKMLKSDDFERVKFLGRIDDRESLLKIYRSHDIFLMVSFKETFGIVYLEAMSQGLPVIYTKGQGIDGYFEDGSVGYSVNPNDVFDIISKIIKIKSRIEKIGASAIQESFRFNWQRISEEYLKLYRQ
jgi:glycosyltransferase involved in cell wall biosynthesis